MNALAILDDLPEGFEVETSPRGILALDSGVAAGFRAAGFGPEQEGALATSDLFGRKPMHQLEIDGERFVVRPFSHGGLMRWLTRSRFLDVERPFRELILSRALIERGLPTPAVVAARARKARGGGWRLEVVTRRVEHSVDLGQLLIRARRGEVPLARLRRVLRAAGRLVRRLHDEGLLHADLNPRNLLAEERGERLWVIDLDRSELRERLDPAARRDNLRRLYRYLRRRQEEGLMQPSRTDYRRFLEGYEPDRSRARELWRTIEQAHAQSSAVHAAGWALERRFAGERTHEPR